MVCVTKLCVNEVACERWYGERWCVTKLCVKAGVAEEEAEAGYRIRNKNPTQRCGEKN